MLLDGTRKPSWPKLEGLPAAGAQEAAAVVPAGPVQAHQSRSSSTESHNLRLQQPTRPTRPLRTFA